MADAAVRREARRKRILENSHNRLQFISGKNSEECSRDSPVRSCLADDNEILSTEIKSESRCSSKSSLYNGTLAPEPELFDFLPLPHDLKEAGDIDVADELSGLSLTNPEPVSPSSVWGKLIIYRYDIVILTVIFQILWSLLPVTYEVYFFLPLVIYAVMKSIWVPVQQQSSIVNALLLLNGLSPDRVQKIMFVTQIVSVFSQDVCVFLFTTICIQSLFVTLNGKFTT